ncbi:MAG: glycosidase [Calditrichaeota bacterium]|nr:MAG: glycosidase [Calditrichota bacterium]
MAMLKAMGVNTIRMYTGVQPRWIKYIDENYGIHTMLNHSFGRYGLTIDGTWVANTDYADPKTRALLISEVKAMVNEFKDVPGVLLFLLGNENNYGLFWGGAETEDIPEGETKESVRARHMYKLFNEAIVEMKKIDGNHPLAICNGDLLFLDIIAEEVRDMDILGTNMYRGVTFTDAFDKVKEKLPGMPILFTEFGADAYNALELREDQESQAYYMVGNWRDIYENTAGKGRAGNAIGGFTFQFSDGWWKYGQTKNLGIHDNTASWANGGYQSDFKEGTNNMNEEWFGICAKGPTNARGLYKLYPRAAYYALQEVHNLNPYAVDMAAIKKHFANIQPMTYAIAARGDKASLAVEAISKVRMSGMRVEMETYNTGGDLITTPDEKEEGSNDYPSATGFDHLQSYYATVQANPSGNVSGNVTLNVLGRVAENPIDEIFYENRGRAKTLQTDNGTIKTNGLERVRVYNASLTWHHRLFTLDGFYRTGHYHWGYEGDFFGLYPEANYGPNIDIYNGEAPLGMEFTGKKKFDGLKVAFGPELWWGANPTALVKYRRSFGLYTATAMYQEDLDEQAPALSSFAVPLPPTRKATLHLETARGPFTFEIGGIWSGSNKVGDTFQIVDGEEGAYTVYQDQIKDSDAFGGKFKIQYAKGRLNWYAQGALMGLVADGFQRRVQTFTGWHLKDSGSGNQMNALTGLAVNLGNWQIAPNFLWQKPIEDPIPGDVGGAGRPRNVLDDPFAVRGNRETAAYELMLTYDRTPGSWMYEWNSDEAEDASLAFTLGAIYRQQPTTRDASIGILADGRTIFAFPGAPPARDVWESHARIVSKTRSNYGFIANLYAGEGEPNGDDDRLINRYGGDVRLIKNSMKLTAMAKFNDWGPYDYHRDFNLTFPMQLMADVSTAVGKQRWFDLPQTRFGVRFTYRTLDQYSPRYCPTKVLNDIYVWECDPEAPNMDDGNEWEIRTYLHMNIGL